MNRFSFLLLVLLFFPILSYAQEKQNNFEISKSIDIYNNVLRYLNMNYVDEINPAELNETAINAMLKELDPYTVFIPESEIEDVRLLTMGEYGGIGMPVEGHTWIIDRKWGYGKNKTCSEEVMKQYEAYLDMLMTFVQTGCAAAVYTQITDVEGEVNGLITYDREVMKVDVQRIAEDNEKLIRSMPGN